jgi:hypothetical protein
MSGRDFHHGGHYESIPFAPNRVRIYFAAGNDRLCVTGTITTHTVLSRFEVVVNSLELINK